MTKQTTEVLYHDYMEEWRVPWITVSPLLPAFIAGAVIAVVLAGFFFRAMP